MMTGIKIEEEKFIPSRDASKLSGYDPDYIGQLCRGGKLECKRVGRIWFINEKSLVGHCRLNGNDEPLKEVESNPTNTTPAKVGRVEKVGAPLAVPKIKATSAIKQKLPESKIKTETNQIPPKTSSFHFQASSKISADSALNKKFARV